MQCDRINEARLQALPSPPIVLEALDTVEVAADGPRVAQARGAHGKDSPPAVAEVEAELFKDEVWSPPISAHLAASRL